MRRASDHGVPKVLYSVWHTTAPQATRVHIVIIRDKEGRRYTVALPRARNPMQADADPVTRSSLPYVYRYALLVVEVLRSGVDITQRDLLARCSAAAEPIEHLSKEGIECLRWVELVIGQRRCDEIRGMLLSHMPREIQVPAQEDIKRELKRRKTRR